MRMIAGMWKSPLVHFVALGTLVFVLYGFFRGGATGDSRRIEVTASEITRMRELFQRQWKRPPTEEELQGLVEHFVREEILYREALAMGLDEGDTVVRRRLAQKVEFLADDLATRAEPTREELSRYFQKNLDRYAFPARRSFSHIYFSVDRRGDAAESDARRALENPEASEGDPFMLQRDFASRTEREVRDLFGEEFARALFRIEPGEWHGPVRSSYGVHLVLVRESTEARAPELAEVSDRIRNDFLDERRREANEALVESLREQYEIVVESP